MKIDSTLIAGISFVILASREIFMFVEVTKIIHRFYSSKGIFKSVNLSFIFTVFLPFTLYYSTEMTPMV